MNVVRVSREEVTELSFFTSWVAAGFPSPADDYAERSLSIDELLIKHPSATYLVRASGDSMIRRGIFDQDILIVYRSIEAKDGDIVKAVWRMVYIDVHK